jgi:UDP-2,4-diacetamido-2,4,6-trideoxy-beta-L-altropyranose hydrolase
LPPLAVFRFDAAPAIGTGHAVRSAALAAELAALGWRCRAAVNAAAASTAPAVRALDPSPAIVPEDSEADAATLRGAFADGCELLVVDHLGRDAGYEAALAEWCARALAFDDLAARRHAADFVVDPTPGRRSAAYAGRVADTTRLLLGPDWTPLRPEFTRARPAALTRRGAGRVRRVLVFVSGSDPSGHTQLFLAALARLADRPHIDAVIGAAAPGLDAVRSAAAAAGATLHVDTPDMAELMRDADLALGAPSSASWERCCLGLPAVVAIGAENQRDVATALDVSGAARVLTADAVREPKRLADAVAAAIADGAWRADASRRGAALCDGRGASRIACALAGAMMPGGGGAAALRPATEADRDRLLDWQREPGARRYARDPAPPSKAGHDAWLAATLADPGRRLCIVERDGVPVGTVRLDRIDGVAFEVSILITAAMRGAGLGRAALALLRRLAPGATLVAEVHRDNAPSRALFSAAGFRERQEGRFVLPP